MKRFITFLFLPFLLSLSLLGNPKVVFAASGGRIGGSNFQSPSIPSTRGYGGGGRYNGGYQRSLRGNGIGFPFILPIFGFGGAGIFGFLILMAISGVLANALKGSISQSPSPSSTPLQNVPQKNDQITMAQIQIGLLASAKQIQEDLRGLALSAETNTSEGLVSVLKDSTLALLRQPELWVYANTESGSVPFSAAESTFNKLSLTERSKLQAEITSNYDGKINTFKDSDSLSMSSDSLNEYIACTIIVACKKAITFDPNIDCERLISALTNLGSLSSSELIALEIIWQPEGEGESLSSEKMLTTYPNLKHL